MKIDNEITFRQAQGRQDYEMKKLGTRDKIASYQSSIYNLQSSIYNYQRMSFYKSWDNFFSQNPG